VTLGTVYLTYWLFETIPNYTTTLPTGQTPGKMWRCRCTDGWLLGMYGDSEEKTVPMYWLDVVIIEGPERRGLEDTDWSNYEHYQRLRKKERAEAQRQEGVS
jgi:hypothetical protein